MFCVCWWCWWHVCAAPFGSSALFLCVALADGDVPLFGALEPFFLLSAFRMGSMDWENLSLLSQLVGFGVGGGSVV